MLDHSSFVSTLSPFLSYFLMTVWEKASRRLSTLISGAGAAGAVGAAGGAVTVPDATAGAAGAATGAELVVGFGLELETLATEELLEELLEDPRATPLSVACKHSFDVMIPSLFKSN